MANPGGDASLSGAAAVEFFRKSEVDKGILRQVTDTWTLEDDLSSVSSQVSMVLLNDAMCVCASPQIWSLSASSNSMTKSGFFTAIRLITMVQNGEIPLSTGVFGGK